MSETISVQNIDTIVNVDVEDADFLCVKEAKQMIQEKINEEKAKGAKSVIVFLRHAEYGHLIDKGAWANPSL